MLRSCDRKNIEKIRDYLNSNNFKQRVRNHGVEPLIRYHEYNNEFRAPTIYIDLSNNDGNIIKDLALKIYDKFKEKFGNEFEVLFDDRYQFTTFTSSLIIPFNRKNLNIIQGNIENAFPLSAPIEKNVDAKKMFEKISKKYPEIKGILSNNPKWENSDNVFNQNKDLQNVMFQKNELNNNIQGKQFQKLTQEEKAKTIEQLFNENPELANAVYEALGFKQNITKNLVKSKHDTDEYRFSIGDFIKEKNSVRVTKNKEGDFSIHEGDLSELTKQQKIALFQEQSNVIPIGGQIVQRGASSFDGIRHRINLKNHGFSIEYGTDNLQEYKSTNKKEVQEFSNLHNLGKVIEKDGKLFTKGVILTKEKNIDQITPQQKQQAQQLYQSFLDVYLQDFNQVEKILKEENTIEKDCTSGGKLKAEKGLQTNFTKGGKWELIKDLKGYPTHKEGGVDLTIGKDGVIIKNGNTQFTAKHGLVIPSWINPKNWGVTDYSDKGDFNTAYSTARKSGEKEFLFNGKRYNTNYKGTPQQQLKETGITDEQIGGKRSLKRVYKNATPYTSYTPPIIQGLSAYLGFEDRYRDINVENPIPVSYYLEGNSKPFMDLSKEEQKKYKELSKPYFKRAEDAWSLYTGSPQRFETFEISKYEPSTSENKDSYYYSLNKSYPELLDFVEKEGVNLKYGESKQVEEPTRLVLRNFKIGKNKDERGDYISYYDTWNLNPSFEFPIPEQGKPFEIYDRIYIKDYGDGKQKRMYYTDKELSELNIDKKDFDILGLQRELSNRGYKLPKSTKQDGSLDGVWGDETKNALLEYRKSQNKSKH